jgi:hypothetical protein
VTAGYQFENAIARRNIPETFDSGKLDTSHNSLVPPPAQQPAAKPPDASSEAIVACKATGRPYTGDQPPPGYPDARRGTGVHGNEWYVPLQKGRWAVLCVAN